MITRERLVLVTAGGLTLVASAAVWASIDTGHVLRGTLPPESATAGPTIGDAGWSVFTGLPAWDRLAYVPTDVLPLELTPPEEPGDGDAPLAWSTETLPESAPAIDGWRLSISPHGGPGRPSTPGAASSQPPAPPQRYVSLAERLVEIGPGASRRLMERFERAKAAWPPAEIGLVALKDEKTLELFARPAGGTWTFVHRYPVLAASGDRGPKLKQGDKQVPEGIYAISFLNPNSRYHVSLRVNYPNAFDRQMAAKDGRHDLGGDIMIHGKALSVGCLAVGDEAAEEIFVLAARVGLPSIKLVIAPTDFRRAKPPEVAAPGQPAWVPKLYAEVANAMAEFKVPPQPNLLSFLWKS